MALADRGRGVGVGRPRRSLPVVAVAVAGVATRRPVVVIVGAALVASALGARAEAGLRPPMVGQWRGTATLVGDPADAFGGVRVDVRIGGKRVEARARGRAAARLRPRLAGEQVAMAGELRPVPDSARPYLSRRHVAARLVVAEVGAWEPGNGPSRLANGIRRTLAARAWSRCPPTAGRSTPDSSSATTGASRSRSPTTSGPRASPTSWS